VGQGYRPVAAIMIVAVIVACVRMSGSSPTAAESASAFFAHIN
jgi:hypothetical protein